MLKLQSGINRDLHKELETLIRNRDKDKRELLDKAENFEQLANKRYDLIPTILSLTLILTTSYLTLRLIYFVLSQNGKDSSVRSTTSTIRL